MVSYLMFGVLAVLGFLCISGSIASGMRRR